MNNYVTEVEKALNLYYDSHLYRGPVYEQFHLEMGRRRGVRERRFASAVTKAHVKAIMDDRTIEFTTRVASLTAFFGLLRAHDYTTEEEYIFDPETTLLREDITVYHDKRIFSAAIRWSKGDKHGLGQRQFWAASGIDGDPYCPYANMMEYLEWFDGEGFDPAGPLFVLEDGRYLTRLEVSKAIKLHAEEFGVDENTIATHGFRYGGAFELRENGADWSEIAHVGRWSPASIPRLTVHYAQWSVSRQRAVTDKLCLLRTADAVMLQTRRPL